MCLERNINRYRFLTFYFWSWIFDKSSKFWTDSCKNESNLLLVWITVSMCSNRNLFRRTMLKKMRERHQLFFGLWLVSKEFQHSVIQTKIVQQFGGFFHQIKVCQPIGRKDSILYKSWEWGDRRHFVFSGSELCMYSFQIFKIVRQLLQSATPSSLRNFPNGRQGHPWLHLPPSPTAYQNRITQSSTRCNLFNYRHRLTKMHKAVEAWKQKKIHK